jgi:predicted TIM-barrel fold metal-dependent hydrolase
MDLSELRPQQEAKGPKPEIMKFRPISADSHIVEPAHLYRDYLDPKFRDRAPQVVEEGGRDIVLLEGVSTRVPIGGLACAGLNAEELKNKRYKYEDINPAAWDAAERLKAQDIDGVVAEVIYPSLGMVVAQMPDPELQDATMKAYNRWLVEFCAGAPKRLFGIGQCAVRDVDSAIADVRLIKEQGFRGIYMNGSPWTDYDYDDPEFDRLWAVCEELELPICFHTFGSRRGATRVASTLSYIQRGTQPLNLWHAVIRDNQDIIGMFVFGGGFERFPGLKLVCVEADAGWAPHFMYRMDHFYLRRRLAANAMELARLPSEYFRQNVYLTFQDDQIAFQTAHLLNDERLMWASDYPHSDSTWPWSHSLLLAQTASLSDEVKQKILHQNVKELFKLEVD